MAIANYDVTNYTTARHTISGRMTGRLSDGTYVKIGFINSGTTPQIRLFTSPSTNAGWTLRCSVNVNSGTTGIPGVWTLGAICVDDLDNIHLVGTTWNSTSTTKPGISYWKLTNGGSLTFTAGSPIAIANPGAFNSNTLGLDIDFVGAGTNGRPILAFSGCTTTNAYCRYYLINGASAVLMSVPGGATPAGAAQVVKYQGMRPAAISGRHQNEADNTLVFMYVYLTTNGGFRYALAKTNNTGTTVTAYGVGLWSDTGASRIQMSWAGDMQVIVTLWISGRVVVLRFQWTAAYVLTRDVYQFIAVPDAAHWYGYEWVPSVISGTRLAIFYPSGTAAAVNVFYIDIVGNTTNGTAVASKAMTYENFANMSAAQKPVIVTSLHGNFNRGLERGQLDPMPAVDYVTKDFPQRVIYGHVAQRAALLPSALVPVPNATINTDIPALSANLGTDSYGVQSDYTVTWQFATESTFAAPITTTFGLVNSGGQAKKILEVVNKLTAQGTWYFRACSADRYGAVSAWSATQTFINTHLPVPVPILPSGDQIVPWNGGNVALDWDFADTSPTATQSAYEVVIINLADGTIVLDTGEVLSSATQAVVTIPGAYKDLELAWTVSLWDDQGVQGTTSQPQSFYASDPPVPILSNPPAIGAVLTSGILNVGWDPGIPGTNKGQARFRVVIQEGANVVHDSGTQISTSTSYAVPVGVIQNNHAYNLSLTIWDTINLSGKTNVSFSAAFLAPMPANGLKIFTYNFERYGYIWCGWTNVNADPDFAYYNLYRRVQGTKNWELLDTVYAAQDFYGYADYTAAANVQYEYAVTQVINSSGTGSLVESNFGSVVVATFGSTHYWIIDPLADTPPVPIFQVTSDTYTDEYERNTYTVIGRGRHTDVGEHLGLNGSITTQARDRSVDQAGPLTNGFADPAFQDNMPYSYEWAFTFSMGGSTTAVLPFECAPSRHENVLRIDTGPLGSVTLTQTLPKKVIVSGGDRFALNAYFDDLLNAYGFVVQFKVNWLDATGATIGTQTVNAAQIENYKGNGNWMRYGIEAVCNVAANIQPYAMLVQLIVSDTSNNGLSFLLDACMANYGTTQTYGDADMSGWDWDGAPNVSGSYTTGYYTARQQRRDIVDLSGRDVPSLLLRTPFGDVYNVAVNDIAFARLPGTGSQVEYGDVTIPYIEVAE